MQSAAAETLFFAQTRGQFRKTHLDPRLRTNDPDEAVVA